jgi:subtilisin family serine protease
MPESTEAYYYAAGERVPLTRRDDLIAVKLRGVDSKGTATRSAGAADVPSFEQPTPDDIWPGGEMVLEQSPGLTRSADDQASQLRALNQRGDVEYASPVYERTPADRWIATNQIVAQFKESLSEYDIDALNDLYGVQRLERIDWLPHAHLLQVTARALHDAVSIANAYVEAGHAVFAHPNFLRKYVHRNAILEPAPGLEDHYWHLSAIEAFAAWGTTAGSPSITVAVIDDGVDVDHAAFEKQAAHFNAIDRSSDPRPPTGKDKHYTHGTACAGLAVGAPNQEIGTSGVAPGCQLMAVRLLDRVVPTGVQEAGATELSGPDALALARALSVVQPYREALAIQWAAENGADVISNSWGPADGLSKSQPLDDIARLALLHAVEKGREGKGCVVCWAAGNGCESISYDGYASHPVVLAVGACTVEGRRAPYSDYGPELDICAPGGGTSDGLLTTVSVDLETHRAYRHNFNGTSAATPIVAGIAALLLSRYPDLTRQEVYDTLRVSADKIDQEDGLYHEDGHSPYYGFGRVNARRALEEAARREG